MEGCHSQGPTGVNANITLSNNPPTDLAFAKRTLRNLLRYSKVLGVDQERRAAWKDALENIAPYPLVKDEDGETVLAQATGDDTGDDPGECRFLSFFVHSFAQLTFHLL